MRRHIVLSERSFRGEPWAGGAALPRPLSGKNVAMVVRASQFTQKEQKNKSPFHYTILLYIILYYIIYYYIILYYIILYYIILYYIILYYIKIYYIISYV